MSHSKSERGASYSWWPKYKFYMTYFLLFCVSIKVYIIFLQLSIVSQGCKIKVTVPHNLLNKHYFSYSDEDQCKVFRLFEVIPSHGSKRNTCHMFHINFFGQTQVLWVFSLTLNTMFDCEPFHRVIQRKVKNNYSIGMYSYLDFVFDFVVIAITKFNYLLLLEYFRLGWGLYFFWKYFSYKMILIRGGSRK